jgi:hypothetical protein
MANDLIKYLNKCFQGSQGTYENNPVDVYSHFLDKFGVNVKLEDGLFLFKYDMLAAKFAFPLVKNCRGHIYRYVHGWKCVANPPDKFFNDHEGFCPIFNNVDFEPIVNQLCAVRKEDGSLITVYFDEVLNDWRCSTTGCVNPLKIQDYNLTFSELFWKIFGEDKKAILSSIGKEYTFCFEMCSYMNRIITKYNSERVYLLLIRHKEYGTYVPVEPYLEMLDVKTPEKHFLYTYGIKNKDDLHKWVESNCNDDDDSSYKEGFVIYHNHTPIAKCKSSKYLTYLSFGGGDVGHTRNAIIDSYFQGTLDDYSHILNEHMKAFADSLKEKASVMYSNFEKSLKKVKGKSFETQKDYALFVQENVSKEFSSFFFKMKSEICSGTIDKEDFNNWIKGNYKKFEDYWKK